MRSKKAMTCPKMVNEALLARRVLISGGPPCWVPWPYSTTRETYLRLSDEFFGSLSISPRERARFDIFSGVGGSTPRPQGYFDVVFCSNVVDRHPNPKTLIEHLASLIRSEGVLFLASPLEWKEEFTPPEFWVDDLELYFHRTKWEILKKEDLAYVFRYSKRKIMSFMSQIVCAKRISG